MGILLIALDLMRELRLRKICGFLKVFYGVTCAFSGSKYRTSNLYFPNVVRNKLVLKDELKGDNAFMRNIATRMFSKFKKYWAEFSTIMAIAGILDPCYKFQVTCWAYKFFFIGSHDAQLGLLKDKLFALYDEYAKASNLASSSAPSLITYVSANVQQGITNEYFEVYFFST